MTKRKIYQILEQMAEKQPHLHTEIAELAALVRKLIEGACKLLAYVKRVALSKVVPVAKNMVKRLNELCTQTQQAQQTHQVTV